MMELRHLRYFIGVAEELHFARAAAKLGISQPPLSQQIHALEQTLGVRLFDRTSRSVRLTSAGKAFLPAARATLDQAARATQVARRAAQGEIGELAIGFNASAPFVPRISDAILGFRDSFPDVHLTLTEVSCGAQPGAILDRSLDLTFIRSTQRPDVPDEVVATRLLQERLYVAMRPDHPLSARNALRLADLAGEPLLLYVRQPESNFTDDLIALLRAAGVEPQVAHTVREVSTLFGLAAAGVGVTVFAESLCALQSANLVYRRLIDPDAVSAMWLMHLRDGASLPCRNFLERIGHAAAGE